MADRRGLQHYSTEVGREQRWTTWLVKNWIYLRVRAWNSNSTRYWLRPYLSLYYNRYIYTRYSTKKKGKHERSPVPCYIVSRFSFDSKKKKKKKKIGDDREGNEGARLKDERNFRCGAIRVWFFFRDSGHCRCSVDMFPRASFISFNSILRWLRREYLSCARYFLITADAA